MRNLLPESSGLGNLSGHVSQRKAQSLKLTDGMTELLALLEISPGILEGRASDADGARRSMYASNVQAALDGGKSARIRLRAFIAVETSETIIFRNAHSIEFEVPSEKAGVPFSNLFDARGE
jgi:hypothetical protein